MQLCKIRFVGGPQDFPFPRTSFPPSFPSFFSLPSTDAQSKVCAVVDGCGFLGRHLTEGLLERGYQVNVFDLKITFENDQVRFFTGDLCRKEVWLEKLSYISDSERERERERE